jgi:patatin-like phospholipase/acyl hydrolase
MAQEKLFRVLSLDGGGAKGFYTLGILREIKSLVGCRLCEKFDLIYGTSTGSIIGAMLGLGMSVQEIIALYQDHVPTVMKETEAERRTAALVELQKEIFADTMFGDMKTHVGVVTAKWMIHEPMIFKTSIDQAFGMKGSFVPGFGVRVGDAVQASCSAYPYFERKTVITANGDNIELIDGGFCANNPTLYAIGDATVSMKNNPAQVRVVSLGCGSYPAPAAKWWTVGHWKEKTPGVQLLQKTLEINTASMERLRTLLYAHVPTVRINQAFAEPAMATDLFEHNLVKLNILTQRGRQSFADNEATLRAFLL